MDKDISGVYELRHDNTFIVQDSVFQLCRTNKNSTKMYLFDVTNDKYISGLFSFKYDITNEFQSFDHNDNIYIINIDREMNKVFITYLTKKEKKKI